MSCIILWRAGKILCGTSCDQKIGPQVRYKKGRQRYGYVLGSENVMWRLVTDSDGNSDYQQIKKWSKVPFPVNECNE